MARGAIVNRNGDVIEIVEAASGLDTAYCVHDGETHSFVPTDNAEVGDTWTEKSGFILKGAAPTLEKFQQALMQEHDFSQDQIDNLTEVAKKI